MTSRASASRSSGVLEDEGYAVEAVESGEACLAALPGGGFELVLLDIWLPGMDGMEVLARIQEMPVRRAAGGGDDLRATAPSRRR